MLEVQHHIQDPTTEDKDEYGASEDERLKDAIGCSPYLSYCSSICR